MTFLSEKDALHAKKCLNDNRSACLSCFSKGLLQVYGRAVPNIVLTLGRDSLWYGLLSFAKTRTLVLNQSTAKNELSMVWILGYIHAQP